MAVILTRRNLAAAQKGRISRRAGGNEDTLSDDESEDSTSGVTQRADDDVARILKMVPGEASAAYTAALALDTDSKYLPVLAFVLCAILIPMLLRRDARNYSPPVTPEPRQYAFQLLAFTAWAFSIRNPLAAFGLEVAVWIPALAILFIPLFGGLMSGDTAPKTSDPVPS